MSAPEDRPLSVLIVDDEALARGLVRDLIVDLPRVGQVEECQDGVEAIAAIREGDYDVVLLDVRMPEVDGFDVIDQVGPEAMPHVIFITGHEEYSLRAFDVHAVDYVLKPCEPDRLLRAFERAVRQVESQHSRELALRLESLLADLGPGAGDHSYAERLTVRDGERFRFVDLGQVDWLEACKNYVRLHVGEESYLVRSSLKALLERLEPRRFARIHRSAIVNIERVREVQPWFGGDYLVILEDGQQLRLSRTYRDRFLALTH